MEENNPTLLEEEASLRRVQRKGPASITTRRIDPEDEDLKRKLKKIMENKRNCIKKKDLLDSIDVIMDPLFT